MTMPFWVRCSAMPMKSISPRRVAGSPRLNRELDELPIVYNLSGLADKLDRSVPPTREAIKYLREQGYRASPVHHAGNSIRTDAPLQVLLQLWQRFKG
jgi:tRNA G26 N,N-dimethylase Trm1